MLYLADILFFVSVFVFCFGYMVNKYTFSKSELCWGNKIILESKVYFARALLPIFASLFGVALVVWVIGLVELSNDFEMDFVACFVVPIVLALVPIPIGLILGEVWVKKALKKPRSALFLERFPIITSFNQYFMTYENKIAYIGIFNNGITFVDSALNTFLIFKFDKFNMSKFSNTKQMLMLSTYFVQKYPEKLKIKLVETTQFASTTGDSIANAASAAAYISNSVSGGNIQYIKLIKK